MAAPAFSADLVLYDALDFSGKVAKAFEAKTGLKVDVVEPGSTGEVLGKIAAEGNNPQFDIVWLDGSAVMDAWRRIMSCSRSRAMSMTRPPSPISASR
jgi:iron(III) transport system substrate-binding protein